MLRGATLRFFARVRTASSNAPRTVRHAGHSAIKSRIAAAVCSTGIALTAASTFSAQAQPSSVVPKIEPATGLSFDARFTVKPDAGCPVSLDFELVGVGARYKYGYVKVYAVGIYLPAGRPLLSAVETIALALDGKLSSVIDIQMAREVGAAAMVAALDEAVRSRIVAKYGATNSSESKSSLASVDAFAALLTAHVGAVLAPGHRLSFMWGGRARDELMVEVNGTVVGTVASRDLCWALLDTYLGAAPVSPSAKDSVLKALQL